MGQARSVKDTTVSRRGGVGDSEASAPRSALVYGSRKAREGGVEPHATLGSFIL